MTVRSLLLSLALTLVAVSDAFAQDNDPTNAFYAAGYDYCDAEALAAVWGGDTWDAKVQAGTMINSGKAKKVTKAMKKAMAQADAVDSICEYNITYTYEDAEALGQLWGVDTWDAKIKLSRMYRHGEFEALNAAFEQVVTPEPKFFEEEVPVFDPELLPAE